jgi:hypothetical protein
MTDYLGVGKVSEKIVEAISKGIGTLYKPRAIRHEADAHAYEKKVIGEAELAVAKAKALSDFELHATTKIQESDLNFQLALRAKERLLACEIQNQKNIEEIAAFALEDVPAEASVNAVDDDWVRTFFRYGKEVSNAIMQSVWAKVLQSEITQPDSFSLRTLQVLSTMGQSDLILFKKFLSLCDVHGRVPCPPPINDFEKYTRDNYLDVVGISYAKICLLKEIGLIGEPEFCASMRYYIPGKEGDLDVVMAVKFTTGTAIFYRLDKNQKDFVFYCYSLTSVARELSRLAIVNSEVGYLDAVASSYNTSVEFNRI